MQETINDEVTSWTPLERVDTPSQHKSHLQDLKYRIELIEDLLTISEIDQLEDEKQLQAELEELKKDLAACQSR